MRDDEAISVLRSLFGVIRTETVKQRERMGGVGGNQREKKKQK